MQRSGATIRQGASNGERIRANTNDPRNSTQAKPHDRRTSETGGEREGTGYWDGKPGEPFLQL